MTPRARPEGFLARHVDPILEQGMRVGAALGLRDPLRWGLAAHRRRAMHEAAREALPRVREIEADVVRRDPGAIERYDALIAEAVGRMRASRPEGGVEAFLDVVERPLYRDTAELLDDPAYPEEERSRALDGLHRLNERLGTYEAFVEAMDPLLVAAERRGGPTRVHDLAAGHAGFAIHLKQRFGSSVVVEASDIKDEYLALGRARAAELGIEAGFYVEDALAIDGPRARGVDILTCTQALHHFPPGMVARMLGEAARAARVGVCFVDSERSWMMCALLGVLTSVYGRSYVLWHDAIASLRRMFYEEELGLFAALAPGLPAGAHVETGFVLPNHAYVRITAAAV